MSLFAKKKQPREVIDWDREALFRLERSILKENELRLKFKGFSMSRERLVVEGKFLKGTVTLRIEKFKTEEQMQELFETVKNTIRIFNNNLQRVFPDREFEFQHYEMKPNLSHLFQFTLDGLEKSISYRNFEDELSAQKEIDLFIQQELNDPLIVGTYIVGESKLEEILEANKGRSIEIKISNKK